MSDLITAKKAILNVVKADTDLQALLGKDPEGNTPVYHGFTSHRFHKPCVTLDDITDQGEVSALGDGYDGASRKEWYTAVVQIDCWAIDTQSKSGAELRDEITRQVKKTILKNQATLRSQGGIHQIQEPLINPMDEPEANPPIYRKALRYRVFYILEA